jgi:hypothetical protein
MSDRRLARSFSQRVQQVVVQLQRGEGLPFREWLSESLVESLLEQLGGTYRERIYRPAVTLWVFLSQVLSADHSCREAVARLLAFRVASGEPPCSPETGAYCTARGRLPEELLARLVTTTGSELEHEARRQSGWLWKGRTVKIVDGTTVTMPDTPENQAAYPQHNVQKPGLGFPIARLVVVFSLGVGTVLEYAIGRYQGKQTGENQLFRGLMDRLESEDVVLADRFYGSYWDFALLSARGIQLVTRAHQRRKADFRRGTRLGPCDHLVRWSKPPQCPEWMDQATYVAMPEELVVREVLVRVSIKGFRLRQYVLTTTLLDSVLYSADDLADLYRARWQAELHLCSLKTVLQMQHLRCQTPSMVHKEIAMHLLAYNLIRRMMAEAAYHAHCAPYTISFKGALQTMAAFRTGQLWGETNNVERHATLLAALAEHVVGNRPNRIEPRAIKRRRFARLLTMTRAEARNRLLHAA